MSREILFYSDFPYGYHNTEAEEKMARFVAHGYRVHYVEQLGIRNPRPRHLGRVLAAVWRSRRAPDAVTPFDVRSPRLIPPRRAPGIAAFNRRWLSRQLRSCLDKPAEAVLWIRFPTPELVPFIEESEPALVVYEVVDDHEASPGITARLARELKQAESRILARAGLVFAWS